MKRLNKIRNFIMIVRLLPQYFKVECNNNTNRLNVTINVIYTFHSNDLCNYILVLCTVKIVRETHGIGGAVKSVVCNNHRNTDHTAIELSQGSYSW